MGIQSRPESRQESRSARKESRIGSDPILFILLDLFIINKIKILLMMTACSNSLCKKTKIFILLMMNKSNKKCAKF